MPLFQYLCKKCETQSEILVRGEVAPACPECGSNRLEKQLSHFAPVTASAAPPVPQGCAGGHCAAFGEGNRCGME